MSHILVVDGSNAFMRLWHTKNKDEKWKFREWIDALDTYLKCLIRRYDPTHMVVAYDSPDCFRYDLYPEYKGTRDRSGISPRELVDTAKPFLEVHGVCFMGAERGEADDVLATIATRAEEAGNQVSLLTQDNDLFAMIKDGWVRCLYKDKGVDRIVREDDLMEMLGIEPYMVRDFKLLSGDKGDNIPKVGIDKQTKTGIRRYGFTKDRAAQILRQYGSLADIYDDLDQLPEKEQEWLIACKDQVRDMKPIVELNRNAKLIGDPELSDVTLYDPWGPQ